MSTAVPTPQPMNGDVVAWTNPVTGVRFAYKVGSRAAGRIWTARQQLRSRRANGRKVKGR